MTSGDLSTETLDELSERYLLTVLESLSPSENGEQKLRRRLLEWEATWDDTGCDRWSFLCYAMVPIAKVEGLTVHQLLGHLESIKRTLDALSDLGIDGTTWIQRGVRHTANAARRRPNQLGPTLKVAGALADDGINPAHFSSIVVPSLIEVSGQDRFEDNLECCRAFFDAVHSAGVGGVYPLSMGIQAIALGDRAVSPHRYDPPGAPESQGADSSPELDAGQFAADITDLRELVLTLYRNEISPYTVVEYGVCEAFRHFGGGPHHGDIFSIALPLAAHGINPQPTLQNGLPGLKSMPEEMTAPLMDFARQLAASGVCCADFMRFSAPAISQFLQRAGIDSGDETLTILRQFDPLLRSMKDEKFQPFLLFEYGFPEALQTSRATVGRIHDALALASDMAALGIDPGPVFRFGLTATWQALDSIDEARGQELWSQIFRGCRQLMDAQLSPMVLLKAGVPTIIDIEESSEPLSEQRLEKVLEILRDCAKREIDANSLFMCTLATVGRRPDDARIVDLLLANLRRLFDALAGAQMDPRMTLTSGLPKTAQAASDCPDSLVVAIDFAEALATASVDPGPWLVEGVPELIAATIDDIEACRQVLDAFSLLAIQGFDQGATELWKVLSHLSHVVAADPALAKFATERIASLQGDGLDATGAMASALPAAVRADRPTKTLFNMVEQCLRCADNEGLSAREMTRYVIPRSFELLKGDEQPEQCVEAWLTILRSPWADDDELREVLLRQTTSSIAHLAPSAGELNRVIAHMSFDERQAALTALRTKLWPISEMIASADVDDPLAHFCAILDALEATAATLLDVSDVPEKLLSKLVGTVHYSAGGDPERFQSILRDWSNRLECHTLCEQLDHLVANLNAIFRCSPQPAVLWAELLEPIVDHHGPRAPWVVSLVYRIENRLSSAIIRRILRRTIAEYGVEAPDLLENFLIPILKHRRAEAVADEEALIFEFMDEVPAAVPELYDQYRQIDVDSGLDERERQAARKALIRDFMDLVGAVRDGDLTADNRAHPLLSTALYHVFPPAVTVRRSDYLPLVENFDDHEIDGPSIDIELPQGGFRVRPGEKIDIRPFNRIAEALHPPREIASDLQSQWTDLGETVFHAWLKGDLRRDSTFHSVLRTIHGIHCGTHQTLPAEPTGLRHLMALGEFLGDSLQEILQEALLLYRETDPGRYDRLVSAKLAPPAHVGKGLIAMVSSTVQQFQTDSIAASEAESRLLRQLRRFDAQSHVEAILQATEELLPELLEALPAKQLSVDPGEEARRIFQDLVGPEFKAMSTELHGDSEQPAKIEFHHEGTDRTLSLAFQVTKRSAHAPIGFCEGVCTARDTALWNNPHFFQCVIWGPGGRALGGVHLMRGERDDGRDSPRTILLLPGINPAHSLVQQVDATRLVDAVLRFARALARAWEIDEVAIPTTLHIASNRPSIQRELIDRDFPRRSIRPTPFSQRPRYTIGEVYLVGDCDRIQPESK